MPDTPVSLLDRLRLRPDDDSWKRLVDLYTPLLHGWLRRHALQPSDVDDLVQEILTAVVRDLPQFWHNERPGAFRRWLRTILVHRLRVFWHARRTRPLAAGDGDLGKLLDQLEDPDSGLSGLWDREHDWHVLHRLLEMIRPDFAPTTWQAFRRTVLDGSTADSVAAEVGLSVNAVCVAKSRVLQRLRHEARGLID
jgi:RNA polymerase sigma-70 factor (ECF subfamily)